MKDVREVLAKARQRLGERDQGTILFLDEVHRFNKAQQDALLPAVEDGLLVLIGATTENPYFEVNPPLLSPLDAVPPRAARPRGRAHPARAGARPRRGRRPTTRRVDHLVAQVGGDGRQVLTSPRGGRGPGRRARRRSRRTSTLADVEAALGTKALRYGRDDHYDVISAFIKSIRGSDPDAGLYWLARMLEAGEDARFIARRLVILASEDIGVADSMGLVVADAAAQAVEFVGLPEAQLNLAQAVVHLATAPKSNRVDARARARRWPTCGTGRRGEVPIHLRGTRTTRGAARLGHGEGYDYPHDDPGGWVDQEYRPAELAGRRYYEPSTHGAERRVAERMAERRPGPTEEDPMSGSERRRPRAWPSRPPSPSAVLLAVVVALLRTVRDLRATVEALRVESAGRGRGAARDRAGHQRRAGAGRQRPRTPPSR